MTNDSAGLHRFIDGPARLATVVVSFGFAVLLAIGPIIWILGTANGDETTIEGGIARLVVQLIAIGILARVASRRSRGLPVFGSPAHQ